MTFRSEVAVCIRSCSYKSNSSFVLVFNATEIFSEGAAQVFLSYAEEGEMARGWWNQPTKNPKEQLRSWAVVKRSQLSQCWGFRIVMAFFPLFLGYLQKSIMWYTCYSFFPSPYKYFQPSMLSWYKIQLLNFVVNFLVKSFPVLVEVARLGLCDHVGRERVPRSS